MNSQFVEQDAQWPGVGRKATEPRFFHLELGAGANVSRRRKDRLEHRGPVIPDVVA